MGLMHRKTIGTGLLLGLALLACTTLAAAERDLAPATPEQVGMSSEKLATLTSALRSEVDDGQLAGIVTLVARHGKLVQQDHYGYQDLENGVAMEQDTIFRIFSMTKPITGVAMMMLHEEGKFALDDPVSKYIPEFV
ncbi:MAG: serine hydrolase domain-containing protein [Gammaproteobacteria bacterium]